VSFGSALLGAQLFGLSGALLGVPVAATVMAMLEIYQRRYELSPQTEEIVAAHVAPRDKPRDAEGGTGENGVLDAVPPPLAGLAPPVAAEDSHPPDETRAD
jgi:hypothetical protein